MAVFEKNNGWKKEKSVDYISFTKLNVWFAKYPFKTFIWAENFIMVDI